MRVLTLSIVFVLQMALRISTGGEGGHELGLDRVLCGEADEAFVAAQCCGEAEEGQVVAGM
ncbi:hypothetical protein ACWCQZ_50660, partial [Streptomyces sp. NPDC002285]